MVCSVSDPENFRVLFCVSVLEDSEVTQSCPTLCDPMDCSLPGSSDNGILQARIVEWVTISSKYFNCWHFLICGDIKQLLGILSL